MVTARDTLLGLLTGPIVWIVILSRWWSGVTQRDRAIGLRLSRMGLRDHRVQKSVAAGLSLVEVASFLPAPPALRAPW